MTGLVFRIIIVDDFAELSENFGDDYLKLVKTFWIDLGNTVNDDDRVDTVGNFWFLLKYVPQQF